MTRRKRSHGCLYTLLFLPFSLGLALVWWIFRLALYITVYLVILCFTLLWCILSSFFDLIFHKSVSPVVCNSGEEYELVCCQRLKQHGFTQIETTKRSGDHGIDIFAKRAGQTYAIQCKYYSSPVGNHAVQEAYSGCAYYKRQIPVVLTNSTFTSAARNEASTIGVELWDKNRIPFSSNRAIKNLFYNRKRR